ncbi:hypothetical protein GGI17_006040 [Coemansia sp. S146]|nr:hypothetical protein GGI17_006040 [Coemansia sp. S146]
MARLSSVILATAAFAAAASAQQCVAKQTQCATDNDSMLLHCEGSTWATSRCASDQYCMTMPGMVHCMLRPEGEKPGPSSPTSAPSSSSSKPTGSSTTGPSPTSESKPKPSSETSKDSGAAANKAAAIGLSVVAVALAALF